MRVVATPLDDAPIDDHLDVRVVPVVVDELLVEIVCQLGWDDAVDHVLLRIEV
ncbi:MAG: hypothetical protein ACXVY8_07055 [Gaiellaceae bacterium]